MHKSVEVHACGPMSMSSACGFRLKRGATGGGWDLIESRVGKPVGTCACELA